MSTFNVGDRIRSRLTARDYTVIAIGNDNTVYISDFYPDGPWRADRFEPATPATPPIGETVAALRKAAGLPPFMVGDVVRSLHQNATATIIEASGESVRVKWSDCPIGSTLFFNADGFTLLTPAPCGRAANDNNPSARKFKVGDWVRDEDGDIGKVIEDDGDPEDEEPYYVEFLEGHFEANCDADELTAWTPREGDYVRASTGETGRVEAVSGAHVLIDGQSPETFGIAPFRITDLEPCAVPEPAGHQWKAGDTVVVVYDALFHDGVKDGAIGVICRVGKCFIDLHIDGAPYSQTCPVDSASDYIAPYTPDTAAA